MVLFLVTVLLISLFVSYGFLFDEDSSRAFEGVFVGVDVAYDDMEANKELIDEVCAYTNLFVIGTTGITNNKTTLNEICQYVYDKDLSFIVYTDERLQYLWVERAINRWGDRFIGLYFWDENGGKQLDLSMILPVMQADNHTDATNKFVNALKNSFVYMNYSGFEDRPLFTSDYVLYWFDYMTGYDVVLTQLGWNYSRQLNIALCRGAATIQDKDWGAMITWTYDQSPYIESGPELYKDLVLAYENGAKYIVVFDTNKDYTKGILKEEHFKALKDFKQYTIENPRETDQDKDKVAFVLPKDYGYGFRGPDDKIWGLWEADSLTAQIITKLGALLDEYDKKLDIIYDDQLEMDATYPKYIFWNDTIITP